MSLSKLKGLSWIRMASNFNKSDQTRQGGISDKGQGKSLSLGYKKGRSLIKETPELSFQNDNQLGLLSEDTQGGLLSNGQLGEQQSGDVRQGRPPGHGLAHTVEDIEHIIQGVYKKRHQWKLEVS